MDQYLSGIIVTVLTGIFSVITLLINKDTHKITDKIDELKNPPVDSTASETDVAEKKRDSKEESKESKESKTDSNEENKRDSKEESKEDSNEKVPLSSNAHYQLTQLRAHIDSLTKEQIKKVIDDILALG